MQKFILGLVAVVSLGVGVSIAQNQTQPNAVNGGIYNATPPTLSNLQRGVFQLDASGNLKVVTSGTPSLPADAATATNQVTQSGYLSSIVTNTTGSATAALQTTGNGYLSTIATNTTGASTAANQSTGNGYLSTLATNSASAATAALQTSGNASLTTIAAFQDALTPSFTTTAASNRVLKASAGTLYGFNGVTGASAGYFLIYNATSAPSNGTVTPVKCYPVPANSAVAVSYMLRPIAFSTGITIVFSTTGCFTQTTSTTAFISGEYQ